MNRFSRVIAVTGLVVLGLVVSLVQPKRAEGVGPNSTQNVNVTNPSLSVNASQSGTWNVGITGTPSVNVGTPTVTIGNPATSPVLVRDLDSPARNPFQVEVCSGTLPYCPGIPDRFNVPVGQEFVVEYVSGKCEGPAGKVSLAFDNAAGSQTGANWLNDLTIADTTGVRFGQVVHIYADPRTQLAFGTYFFGGPGQGRQGCDISLSGYMVTL
jgi:hypothetical protein